MTFGRSVIALLEENLTEEQYKAALNEHLSFEIDSAINLRKTKKRWCLKTRTVSVLS